MKPNVLTNCTTKKKYSSEQEAIKTAEYLYVTKEISLGTYKCQICHGFHLTSRGTK